MKTIQAIVELARESASGEVLAMATVMKVRGSAYRRPGARMLMNAAGRTAGMISYLGILGPKSRTQRLPDDDDENLARLHAPAGLDRGAETPEEIAVSIIGEMQAVLAQRNGGALRDRNPPIHDPADATPGGPHRNADTPVRSETHLGTETRRAGVPASRKLTA